MRDGRIGLCEVCIVLFCRVNKGHLYLYLDGTPCFQPAPISRNRHQALVLETHSLNKSDKSTKPADQPPAIERRIGSLAEAAQHQRWAPSLPIAPHSLHLFTLAQLS
jgi:hypothetical protein